LEVEVGDSCGDRQIVGEIQIVGLTAQALKQLRLFDDPGQSGLELGSVRVRSILR